MTSGDGETEKSKQMDKPIIVFDSKTGYLAENDLASLTIISEKSLDGEIWRRNCLVKAAEVIRELNNIPNIEAISHYKR